MSNDPKVIAHLHDQLSNILAGKVAPLFVGNVKLTLIARLPGNQEADVLVTNDDPREAIALIERRIQSGEKP